VFWDNLLVKRAQKWSKGGWKW